MSGENNLLVVINPAQEVQPALNRAVINATGRGADDPVHITLLICSDPKNRGNGAAPQRNKAWLDELLQPLAAGSVSHQVLFSWSDDWADSILSAAETNENDTILISHYGGSSDKVLSDELWYLLRNIQVPTTLVQDQERKGARESILVALKAQNEKYHELNARVIDKGRWLAEIYGAELHVVNAYDDAMDFPDQEQLLRETGVPRANLNIKTGAPEQVIKDVADAVNADLLLIGTARRTGLRAALRGNTIEKIIDKLDCDIGMLV